MEESKKKVTFILGGEETIVEYEEGDSLLDTALKAQVPAPYSCMQGVCYACMAKCLEGEVTMTEDCALDDEDRAQGRILTCQSKAVSSHCKISYDDL